MWYIYTLFGWLLSKLPFFWRAGTKLNVRKSRCGLLGLCRSAARMWLAVSSPSCTSALHSVHPGMTGIPVWREPAWRRICKNHKCPGRDRERETPADWPHTISDVWQWHREECTSPPYVDLSFKKSSLWSSSLLLSWDTSDNIIMGQADVSRPVNPDATGE